MAYYAALASVVQLLKDTTLHDRYSNSFLAKHQLHVSLYEKLKLLQEMLDDYSPNDHNEKSNDILERRIRDVAHRAQDLIESQISTTLLPHVHLEKTTHDQYYRDLEKVETEVDSVLGELTRIKVESNTVHEDLQPNSYISVETSRVQAPSGKNTMFVFDEKLMTTVKAQLCGESSNLEVISIVGLGGLGKTTLARNIFDDRLTHDRFDRRAWVTVSQDYHLKNILLAIVISLGLNEREFDGVGEGLLQQRIYQNLFGRRYLIIIDDVWETRVWDDTRRIFPDNSNGSRIMITTRLSDVADCASSSKCHHQMQFLDEDQSWTLLREKVFGAQEQCPEELEVIGKSIAKNCGGLPLAIVVIAGVLSNVKRMQHDWENIARKVSSTAIDQNDQHLSKILSLSYNHLPHHLKPCFLYFGGYPEDHEIRISKLIRLWVAEGFLKPIESKSLEEVGEKYFKDLVNRNLVLITKTKSNGKFKFCNIHDVLRELCFQRAHDENFLLCVQRKDDFHRVSVENVRRVYNQASREDSLFPEYIKIHDSHVRSLISCSNLAGYDSSSIASCSKLLRIWDKEAGLFYSNFDEITELLHLKYLNIFGVYNILERRFNVPSCVFHLQNLQTLILRSHASLPSEIWKMPQLRHVLCKMGVVLPPIPYDEVRIIDGVPLLGNLQTLSRVSNFRFTSDTVEMIPSLKKLVIDCHDEEHEIWEYYELSNLVHLHQLETLYIEFNIFAKSFLLPDNFAFPSALIKLTLVHCSLPWKDMSVVGSLPNLQVLKLSSNAFRGVEWEPVEGQFLKLKFLEMYSLSYLEYWRAENTHFPLLEQLHIIFCDVLEEIPPGIGDTPTLQLLILNLGHTNNPSLESSALEIQQQQQDLGNDDLRVRVIKFPQHDPRESDPSESSDEYD